MSTAPCRPSKTRCGLLPGLRLGVTGSAAVGSDMSLAIDESMRRTEAATIALVALILLLIYRPPGLLLVPLATIFTSLAVAMAMVALAVQVSDQWGWVDFKIFKTTRIFVVVILFGTGTDFCLFLISRYREECARSGPSLGNRPGRSTRGRHGDRKRDDHGPRPGNDGLLPVREIS